MIDTFRAPCGWQCHGGDDPREPAVDAAIATLKAAGLTALIVAYNPTPDEWVAGSTEPSREAMQALCHEAAGFLCHLSKVQPVEVSV